MNEAPFTWKTTHKKFKISTDIRRTVTGKNCTIVYNAKLMFLYMYYVLCIILSIACGHTDTLPC